jgi:tRNA-dihydrouridine synthase B
MLETNELSPVIPPPFPHAQAAAAAWARRLAEPEPVLVLAPMQDVTNWSFWNLTRSFGGADFYVTEFFRVHADSGLEKHILRSLTENPTGRPALAQMIGNDVPSLVRIAALLERHAVAGIDLNLGCPAPVVYRKCAGGGLLRELERVDAILGALRQAVTTHFTVKTRVGFDDPATFDQLLPLLARHRPDLVTVHGRLVTQMYQPGVRYDLIAQAAASLPCPVIANGDIFSTADAVRVLQETGVRGLMIGRGAIRNPWLFSQIRARLAGQPVFSPTRQDLLLYIHQLWDSMVTPDATEHQQVQRLKKFMNFIVPGVPDSEAFLHDVRRVQTKADFFALCLRELDRDELLGWD